MKNFLSLLLSLLLILPTATLLISAEESGIIEVTWTENAAVVGPYNPYGPSGYKETSNGYSTTNVFTVPKAGTRITWVDTDAFCAYTTATLSSWKMVNGEWVWDTDGPLFIGGSGGANAAIESKKANGKVTYSYVTSTDNENLRITIQSKNQTQMPVIEYKVSGEKGTWESCKQYYFDADFIPVDPISDLPIAATKVEGLSWQFAYIGSDQNTAAKESYYRGDVYHLCSDVFTVPKAGTTVYFYDTAHEDAKGATTANRNVYVFSHWKKSGNSWVIDKTKENIAGHIADYRLTGTDYYLYWYTTTEDNENLRISYRAGAPDVTLAPKATRVFLSLDLPTVTEKGKLVDANFLDAQGNTVGYRVYLPEQYPEANSRVLVSIGQDEEIIRALADADTEAVLLSIPSEENCDAVLNALIDNYELNRYLLHMVAPKEILNRFSAITVASATNKTGYASALDAGNALLCTSVGPYYPVLEGAAMFAIGDSLFGGYHIGRPNTWFNRVGDKYGMDLVNLGIGGSTVSNYVTKYDPMVDRFDKMPKRDADIIIIECARNDMTQLTPFGDNDSRDTKTIMGAFNVLIDRSLEQYPNAIVVLITPWYMTSPAKSGETNITLANAMRSLVEYRNDPRVFCLYAADPKTTGVNMSDAAFRAKYSIKPNDGSHLNPDGMKLTQPYMEKMLAEMLAEYRGIALTDTGAPTTVRLLTPPETTGAPETTVVPETTDTVETTAAPDTTVTEAPIETGTDALPFIAAAAILILISIIAVIVIKNKKKK